MKRYIKHHLPYLLLVIIVISLFMSLMYLDGYHNWNILIYGCLLILVSTISLLGITWFRQRQLYSLLSLKKGSSIEKLAEDGSTLSNDLYRLMSKEQLNYYQEIKGYKNKMADHQNFMYEWVHQMKTPITVMELMIDGDNYEKDSLLEEIDKLKEGLNLALNMARLDAFQHDLMIEKVNIRELVVKILNEQKRNLIRNEIYPKVLIEKDLFIESDQKWLGFCLTQIILNSIKYTEKNEHRLEIKAVETSEEIQVMIKDYGMGISQSNLPRIFRPFFTGKTGREIQEATGMGLYLTQQVCLKLNHRISVESKVNKGTVMIIHLNNIRSEAID
ncbi:sensor histidine kinase [Vagococcus hydrophili]|uniref:histidine kinase n=1 Tax=Vagococcus hydrophili TaxID=2714947 RepID=A0A6G8AWU1_9ENTE|nr:sensor histidine kinase [Vagococcus hydrophili]QIL49429.1 HAMP domain-containing histidine kinase [Vagococcus hydrophili]